MARKSQWDNPEMWEQCRVWKDGGMTYTDICGQLARTENLQRFGLHKVPSEDTVRREVDRLRSRSPKPKIGLSPHVQATPGGDAEVDIELGPHWRELYCFGRCFRDRLAIPDPDRVVMTILNGERRVLPWTGHSSEDVLGPLEQTVDKEWDAFGYDATQHSLFPSFKQHLKGCDCWGQLEGILPTFDAYIEHCQDIVSWLLAKVSGGEGIGLDKPQAGTFIEALVTHSWHYKITSIRLFTPIAQQTNSDRTKGWEVVLGAWYITCGAKERANRIADAFNGSAQEAITSPLFDSIFQTHSTLIDSQKTFQKSLSPDVRLRKLLTSGHCDLCP